MWPVVGNVESVDANNLRGEPTPSATALDPPLSPVAPGSRRRRGDCDEDQRHGAEHQWIVRVDAEQQAFGQPACQPGCAKAGDHDGRSAKRASASSESSHTTMSMSLVRSR